MFPIVTAVVDGFVVGVSVLRAVVRVVGVRVELAQPGGLQRRA